MAGRAGHKCSYPECGRGTSGPGVSTSEVAITGDAAHIYSAADRGPRGRGGLSISELTDVKNGIWLCAEHHRLIDLNRGDRFPPETLNGYKDRHERRIAKEQGYLPFREVEEIYISCSSVFADDTVLRLSKVMLIVGSNGTGKTFLFRLLNSLSNEPRSKLGSLFREEENLSYSIRLSNPEHQVRFSGVGNQVTLSLDGAAVPFNPLTVAIFFEEERTRLQPLENFLRSKRSKLDSEPPDDLLLLSEYWEIEPDLVRKLVAKAGTFVEHAFNNPRFEVAMGVSRLLVNDKRWRPDASIHKISGGMLEMLSLDVAIAYAMHMSEHHPTMLLLNTGFLHLDHNHMGRYVDFLLSNEVKFQTLIATCSFNPEYRKIPWEIVHIRRVGGKSIVELEQAGEF